MQFHVEQRYRAPLAGVSRAYTEPELYALFGELPKLGEPEVLDRGEEGGRVQLAVRYSFTGELSGAVRAVIDPERLTWVEHTVHDLARRVVELRIVPDHYAHHLRASARSSLRPDGTGTLRVTDGEVSVRGVPFVGASVERAIVSGIEKHLAAEVDMVERYVTGPR